MLVALSAYRRACGIKMKRASGARANNEIGANSVMSVPIVASHRASLSSPAMEVLLEMKSSTRAWRAA